MIDQILLNDTLQTINISLNKRFEKDANLYISKQDEYELKKHICNNAFGAVADMLKGKDIGPEILVKVLIRNAGVMQITDKKMRKELKPILQDVQYKPITYVMEDVLHNNVYIQKELKRLVFKYFINGISNIKRLEYWKSKAYHFDEIERKMIFDSIMLNMVRSDPKKTLLFKLQFCNEAFKNYPLILKDEKIFSNLREQSDELGQGQLFTYLCKEVKEPSIDDELYNRILVDGYVSYGKKALDDAITNIKSDSAVNFKQYIKAITTIFRQEKDLVVSVEMFDTLYKAYKSVYMKHHIKRQIDQKVWGVVKNNSKLYESRKVQIDSLGVNEKLNQPSVRYTSYEDVYNAMKGENAKNIEIAYQWINMKKNFEQSLIDSFNQASSSDEVKLKDIYHWIFLHSQKRGGIQELSRICESMATAILSVGTSSKMAQIVDNELLEHVIKYSVEGKHVKTYLAKYHYEKYQKYYIG